MQINKNQALYKALPHSWTTYSDSKKSDYKYACKVKAWNTKKVLNINESMIRNDIVRSIKSFEIAGGIVSEDFSNDKIMTVFEFVEPSIIDGIPDIVCSIEPTTFYCRSCDKVITLPNAMSSPVCPDCQKRTNQLQMVYACECGYAEGVKPFKREDLYYHSRDRANQFKFFTRTGQKEEMRKNCPMCNKILLPKNATDSRLFYTQSGTLVNLFNQEYAETLKKYGFDAELLMLAKWLNIISHEEFLRIITDPKSFFEKKQKDIADPDILKLAKAINIDPMTLLAGYQKVDEDSLSVKGMKNKINEIIPLETINRETLQLITSELMEFDILKYPVGKISLEDAIEKSIEIGKTFDEQETLDLCNRFGLSSIQISESVQIVKYAYGYTRLRSCPDSSINLKIRGFGNKVYTTVFETEGILFQMDMLKIYRWLEVNHFVTGDEIINTEADAKKWFLENIHLNTITHFSTIAGGPYNLVTKIVYSLLHTLSHMTILSAGKHSGLSRDSFSEIIFPDAASFFIYPTSSEGVALGSISGMFETDINLFLEDALIDNEVCTFDPVCSITQNGACVACCYISEVNCAHFNKDLSRSYLYGGTIKINEEIIEVIKGFWK